MLSGCASVSDQAEAYARRNGLNAERIWGTRFRHEVFVARRDPRDVLYVFIEGDGSPWIDDGLLVARDPTPARPLALELATRTPRSVLYLGRPCYLRVNSDKYCLPELWTAGRYSADVVLSLAAAANRYAEEGGFQHLVLIGYSGGGALAVLMAPHVPTARAVITIAANLDVDAWSRWHHYLPLKRSLNPATQPLLDAQVLQLHLIGTIDSNVPEKVNRRYFDALGEGQIWRFEGFDHTCCWVTNWPDILRRIADMTNSSIGPGNAVAPAQPTIVRSVGSATQLVGETAR